jgi:GPI-anchor transamidase subunit GAA1
VFLLLGMEAIRNYKINPHLVIGTHQIPTWTTPLLLVFVVSVLVPGTSLLGHLCGLAIGYICEPLGPLAPARIISPRLPQVSNGC